MVSKQAVLRTAVPSDLRDWVDNRLINAHIRIVKAMVFGTLLNAVVIVLALISEVPGLILSLFFATTLAAGLHRLWLAEGIARGRRQKRQEKMMFAFRMNSWWMGLNLGVLVALWFAQVSAGAQILLAVCTVSQIASAAYTVRTLPHSATVYVAAQALGLAIGLAQQASISALGAIAVLASASALLVRMAFTARDLFITRILSDRELGESGRTVKLLLNAYEESGSDWLFELDQKHRLIKVSTRFAEAAGKPAVELEGKDFISLFTQGPASADLAHALAERRPVREAVLGIAGAGDQTLWWSVNGRPSNAGDGVAYRGVISDVTIRHEAESRALQMAHFDTLTGLPNRALFDQQLESAIVGCTADNQIALLLLDIDHFKNINDFHGHPIGDAYLRYLADRITQCVQASGLGGLQPMIARLGGDEFALVVTGADACDHAIRLSDLLLDALAQTTQIDGHELTSGVSIGIALAPFHTELKQQLQSYADIALHAAKEAGRGTWEMFEPGMDAVLHERHLLSRDLRHAVARGELRLFVQPLVDATSEVKTGYEALLRWQHPERGLVAPDDFIPIAEETGLIVPIGEWVIRTALAEAAGWPGSETIAINLSPVQIGSPSLLPTIINALAVTGLDPARVEFEITEGVLLQNSDTNLLVLNRLHALGVKIALDDFGTGYASLNYLLTFPFDKIKIDRRFISDLATREESRAIVGAVIALANQLGMCTLAEGVEEPEQLAALRLQGCRMAQGWLFGKALPTEEYHPRAHPAGRRGRPVSAGGSRSRHTLQTYSRRQVS